MAKIMENANGFSLLADFADKQVPVTIGDKLSFRYNGKGRIGTVDKLGNEYLTIDNQDSPNGFKSFRFDGIDGNVTILSRENGKRSAFVESLKR